MSAFTILQLAIVLLKTVLNAANLAGAVQVADGVAAAIAKLEEVHGSEVTKAQVDSLTIEKLW